MTSDAPAPRLPFPEPTSSSGDPAHLVARVLDYLRDTVVHKVRALDDPQRRTAPLDSGWTPLELLWHLAHMERRWIEWGFLGIDVDDPWGDHAAQQPHRWRVPPEVTLVDVERRLAAAAAQTTRALATHPLETPASVGGRFDDEAPTLGSIAVHVLQEYARHAGQLDVVVEILGGPTGE